MKRKLCDQKHSRTSLSWLHGENATRKQQAGDPDQKCLSWPLYICFTKTSLLSERANYYLRVRLIENGATLKQQKKEYGLLSYLELSHSRCLTFSTYARSHFSFLHLWPNTPIKSSRYIYKRILLPRPQYVIGDINVRLITRDAVFMGHLHKQRPTTRYINQGNVMLLIQCSARTIRIVQNWRCTSFNSLLLIFFLFKPTQQRHLLYLNS